MSSYAIVVETLETDIHQLIDNEIESKIRQLGNIATDEHFNTVITQLAESIFEKFKRGYENIKDSELYKNIFLNVVRKKQDSFLAEPEYINVLFEVNQIDGMADKSKAYVSAIQSYAQFHGRKTDLIVVYLIRLKSTLVAWQLINKFHLDHEKVKTQNILMEIDIDFISNSRSFLQKFVQSHALEFHEDMVELHPRKGYGDFPYSSEIVQCMREIAHKVSETFGDLSIPERFTSPEDLINQAKRFIDLMESFESYFVGAIQQLEKKNLSIPIPVHEIDANRRTTIDVFRMFVQLAEKEKSSLNKSTVVNLETPIEKIATLLRTFHTVATQLTRRRNEAGTPRPTLTINDEYDVQDLLHALLKQHFLDIRPEEWNPSYAGAATRSDFLIKTEQIVIEVKKTRAGLTDREVGEQLIIDKEKYKKHPDCKTLICFVYDPEKRLVNPHAIINDLKEIGDSFSVLVFINPI